MKQKKIKLGLISSFHNKSLDFHNECMHSILNQTDKDFSFYLFADNIRMSIPENTTIHIDFEYVENLTPRQIRARGIQKAFKDGCDYILFVDSDDIMHKERIEKIKCFLLDHLPSILIHNLSLINRKGDVIKKDVFDFYYSEVDNGYYWWKNNSGLGNTVYKTNLLFELLPFPEKTYTLDWTIIFILSLEHSVTLYDESLLYYRQHSDNKIGINKIYNHKELKKTIDNIDAHYDSLIEYFTYINKSINYLNLVEKLKESWSVKREKILADKNTYLNRLNKISDKLIWNELI